MHHHGADFDTDARNYQFHSGVEISVWCYLQNLGDKYLRNIEHGFVNDRLSVFYGAQQPSCNKKVNQYIK